MPAKPSEQEDEYFARREFERRRQALSEQASATAEEERLRILAVARGFGELDQVRGEEARCLGSLKRIFR